MQLKTSSRYLLRTLVEVYSPKEQISQTQFL